MYGKRLRERWERPLAGFFSSLMVWTFVVAPTGAAVAQHPKPDTKHQSSGFRKLSSAEMLKIRGATGGVGTHAISVSEAAGTTYPWEGSVGGTNTGDGNKLTSIPIVGWTQRGGMPVSLTLNHNSEGNHNSELGQKWTFSYDIYLASTGTGTGSLGNLAVHLGDDLSYQFTNSGSNVFSAPTGIHDTLVLNVDGSLTLTKTDQTKLHFTSGYYCDSITDENGNAVAIARNSSNYITSITDATSRAITLGYDSSNRINSITDPLSRVWTISYSSTGNNLASITYPVLGTSYYTTSFSYNSNHDITGITSPGSRSVSFTYNSDDSLASSTDGCSNTTSYTYVAGQTTITDANSHVVNHYYTSGRLSQIADNSGHTVTPTYDSANNVTSSVDQRGYTWSATFDSSGNRLTAVDPYSDTTTWTYNSHNKLLTVTQPTGESVALGYDSDDNCTSVAHKDSGGTTQATETLTYGTTGLLLTKTDANSNETQYSYSTNGDLATVNTPSSKETQFGYNGIGVETSRIDAMGRETDYTLDNWNRVTTATYPDSSTHTFAFDVDSNLTSFTDASGTTSRAYDGDCRMTSESKGGVTLVSHSYDATGKKGLLSTTTDSNSRVLTYAYTGLNQLYSVAETAGTTYYSYDAAGNETGTTNANGTTAVRTFDHAGKLATITNSSVISGTTTTLNSYSYVYDASGRRTSCTEANSDLVSYGYDWGSRLTSESRTGSNAYSTAYTVDAEGRRTAQSVTSGGSTATTSFTVNNDDEITATSSSTGGFTNSYSYNDNGEQTGRTLSGTSYTAAFDYDGQMTSLTQGSATTSFTYDAAGRRVSRTASGTQTDFQYDGGAVLLEKQGSTITATYSYGNSLIRKDGETPLYDELGTARAETSSSQAVTATLTTEAFGNTVASTGSTGSKYGFAASSGYRADGDAGLSKVGCRYYDAQTGTFTTRDTYLDQKPYLYCEHDPVNGLDPSGHYRVFGFTVTNVQIWTAIGGAIGTVIEPGIGTAIGAGIGRYIGGRRDGEKPKAAGRNGVVVGGLTLIGGKLLVPVGGAVKGFLFPEPIVDPGGMSLGVRGRDNGWFR